MAIAAQRKVEIYLGMLRARLRVLGNEEVKDIIEELRSHILEKINGERRTHGLNRRCRAGSARNS